MSSSSLPPNARRRPAPPPSYRQQVVNGRLVRHGPGIFQTLDSKRSFLTLALCLILWCTNPANRILNASAWDNANEDTNWMTNYGFFSILERGKGITLSIATFQLDCPFDDSRRRMMLTDASGRVIPDVCTVLRNAMAHEKPLLWDPDDIPYTIHRVLIAILFLMTIGTLCRKPAWSWNNTNDLYTGSLRSLLLANPQQPPLLGFALCVIQALWILCPIWKVLCEAVLMQADTSWFRIFADQGYPEVDIAMTVLTLILLAAAVNALCCQFWINHVFLLRFEGILAAALGYYRGVLMGRGSAPPGFSLLLLQAILRDTPLRSHVPNEVSVNAVTWTLLIGCGAQQSIPSAVAFFLANLAGAHVGQYQYQHLGIHAALRQVAESLQDVFSKLFAF